ncbi:MAG: HAMP domain-containing sensor histidine kinase [Desulfuromonadaceae bacterium]|nr:HAMP domain-containing sensor histidine kinase [Desulfuromonadaceae bacterium]
MKFQKPTLNPLLAFIAIQCCWIAVVIFWVYWFLGSHHKFRSVAEQYGPELPNPGIEWFILFEGLLLLLVILGGVYVIFLYWRRQLALNREQRFFISQVTHELKSPVASLQLHLETIERHHPPDAQLDEFVATMISDTRRLDELISKMLTANRLEQSRWRLALRPHDLSDFVENFVATWEKQQQQEELNLTCDIVPSIHVRLDPETFSVVLRNLLENALKYSNSPAQIHVRLRRAGNFALLQVRDQGRGIPTEEQRRVFRMFYRRPQGEYNVKGTGLGLFIVKALVKRHKGQVELDSAGRDRGCCVSIKLPLLQTREGE